MFLSYFLIQVPIVHKPDYSYLIMTADTQHFLEMNGFQKVENSFETALLVQKCQFILHLLLFLLHFPNIFMSKYE